MTILAIIGIIILAIVILIFISTQNLKKKERQMQALEHNNPAPQEKLPFLALGNILLLNEPNKTLKILDIEDAKKKLANEWNITGRESAMQNIQWLLEEGQRQTCENNLVELRETLAEGRDHELKSNYSYIQEKLKERIDATDIELQNCNHLSAFDWERLSTIARFSYNLGYLSEEECYAYLEDTYQKAAAVYANWREYAIAFYVGFTICTNSPNPAFMISYAADHLKDQNSLWSLYPLKSK